MKKLLTVVFFFSLVAIWADGGWIGSRGFDISAKQLYSPIEHPSVSLEKEFLALEDIALGRVRAKFQFYNSSASDVSIDCGFPIGLPIQKAYRENDPYYKKFLDTDNVYFFGTYILNTQLVSETRGIFENWFALPVHSGENLPPGLFSLDKADYPLGRKEVDAKVWVDRLDLKISWNGEVVPVDKVILDYGTSPADLMVHFFYRLTIKARSRGELQVIYSLPLWAKQYSMPRQLEKEFMWNYVIGTASTWKGGLGDLVLALPHGPVPTLPKAAWDGPHAYGAFDLYRVRSWKPSPDDRILASKCRLRDFLFSGNPWETYQLNKKSGVANPEWVKKTLKEYTDVTCRQEFVRDIKASSTLNEKTELFVALRPPNGLEISLIKPTGYEPEKAFDGLRESAWVPAGGNDGIGEWIQFTLTCPIRSFSVQNGFLRVTPFAIYDNSIQETQRIWQGNARIKEFELTRIPSGESLGTIELKDDIELQGVFRALDAGTYRLTIRSVYPGETWHDVGLGELHFFPWDKGWSDDVAKDSFFDAGLKSLPDLVPLWDRENLKPSLLDDMNAYYGLNIN